MAIAIVGGFITNPSEVDFKKYLKEEAKDVVQSKTGLSKPTTSLLVNKLEGLVPKEVDNFIQRENYFVFSIYTVDFSILGSAKYKVKYLGIFTKFVPMD